MIRTALESADRFVSAQQLRDEMVRRGEDVGLATVYRNLQMLAEDGEADALRDDQGEMLYRMCEGVHHHHHLVCRTCGTAVEVEGKGVESWADQVADQYGFADVSHTVELFGICADCQDDND